MNFWAAFATYFILGCVGEVVIYALARQGRPDCRNGDGPCYHGWSTMVMLIDGAWFALVIGGPVAAFAAAAAAYDAVLWWSHTRRDRRRRAERAAGVVRDLGHRLTVVPVEGDQ